MHKLSKSGIAAAVTALSLFVCILVAPVNANSASADWHGTFAAPDNNTVTSALSVKPDGAEKLWSANVGNSTVVVVGDYVYTYDSMRSGSYAQSATLYKLNRATGEVVDSNVIQSNGDEEVASGLYYSYMIYAEDTLYVGTPRAIQAFDPNSLERKWISTEVRSEAFQSGNITDYLTPIYATLQYVNGCIVSNGTVLNAADGSLKATLSSGKWNGKITDTTAVGGWANGVEKNGYYYVADATESLYVFDTTSWKCVDELSSGLSAYTSAPGVMYYDGAIYWGGVSRNARMIKLTKDGKLDDGSLKTVNSSLKCYGAPVAANGRVYIAGMTGTGAEENTGEAKIRVFNASDMSTVYTASVESSSKIQSTPILSVSGDDVCVYVQGYAKGEIYALMDKTGQTSGKLVKVVDLPEEDEQYAWEQIACDADGALYFTNDNCILWKYQVHGTYGDVDGDGTVGTNDPNVLRRYLAGQSVKVDQGADVNCDGKINALDLIILERYLWHWDGYETLPVK